MRRTEEVRTLRSCCRALHALPGEIALMVFLGLRLVLRFLTEDTDLA